MVIRRVPPEVGNDVIARMAASAILLVTLLCLGAPTHAADDPASRFDAAIAAARAGDQDRALPVLRELVSEYPDNSQFLNDYITVLCWANHRRQALALLPRLDLAATPDYVLDNLAPAALQEHRYATAGRLYDRLLRSQPDNVDYRQRRAWALLETGSPEQAYRVLHGQAVDPQTFVERLTALARTTRDANALATSLVLYDKLIEMNTDSVIVKERIQLLSRMGASYLAGQLAHARADVFSNEELDALDGDVSATRINWRPLSVLEHGDPNYETDIAIERLLQQLQRYEEQGLAYTPAGLRCQFDLITAWHDRGQPDKAIRQYRRLNGHNVDSPLYVRAVVADAYLSRREPEQAKALYEDILAQQADDIDVRLGLYYTLLDLDDYDGAQALIDELAANEQAWLCDSERRCSRNRRKLSLDIAAAMTHAYREHPEQAEAMIQPLYTRAPNNPELRLSRAVLHYWRGEPHLALKEVELVQWTDPDSFDAAENRFNLLMALMDYPAARRELMAIRQRFGDGVRQHRLESDWRNHNRNELNIDVNRGMNSGTQISNWDLVIDSRLYSRPLHLHFRPYVHSYYTRSKLPEGRITYHRFGIGLEYRSRDLLLNAEAHHNPEAGNGVALTGRWSGLDHWSFEATLDSNDADVPLRGRFNEGITGRSAGVGVSYLHNEALRIDGAYKRLSFSDGNLRRNLSVVADRRLFASPRYLLNGRLAYYGSSNTRPAIEASYYNPERDHSVELGFIQEWVQYRFYDASFRHRLETTAGRYYQSGFAASDIWTVAYEQQWTPQENFTIAYGLGRSQRSYDATREYNNWLMLRLNWRF